MRGNPDGSLSSAGRFATGLLSFRYTVWIFLKVTRGNAGWPRAMVAAGVNPAARATLDTYKEGPATLLTLEHVFDMVEVPPFHSLRLPPTRPPKRCRKSHSKQPSTRFGSVSAARR